ncbi:uncharacterized protein BKCO1_2800038 [Diplodia corticola]|uniref:Uncharacterized protein n=1 Tax=Diplodia corticola TaxID=236234 RepID=A0A1J9RZA5_9PEZI|nr:uncharacterized protein BKCO1_2800038 [Diplodia corticola]OJD33679.1 hypothetical protein BKCO1_2800038 [Diplodia corticola]
MRFDLVATFLALGAGSSFVAAAPMEGGLKPRATQYGKCNGTSCSYGGINYDCDQGTSCIGPGGGDGASCTKVFGDLGKFQCPVKH